MSSCLTCFVTTCELDVGGWKFDTTSRGAWLQVDMRAAVPALLPETVSRGFFRGDRWSVMLTAGGANAGVDGLETTVDGSVALAPAAPATLARVAVTTSCDGTAELGLSADDAPPFQ